MKNEITHKAKVIEMTPDFTTVEILVPSACAECHAKGLCGVSETEEKILSLPTDPYATYNVGDDVTLCTKKSMGDFDDFNIIFVKDFRRCPGQGSDCRPGSPWRSGDLLFCHMAAS